MYRKSRDTQEGSISILEKILTVYHDVRDLAYLDAEVDRRASRDAEQSKNAVAPGLEEIIGQEAK